MVKKIEANLNAQGKKFGIVASRFNEFITNRLVEGAIDSLKRHGASENNIEVIWCPGSFEIPLVCQTLLQIKKYNAVLALGAVIRGETPHFEYVASEVTKGVAKVSLDTGIPVVFGVITADSLEHAIDRAGMKSGNKGAEAAESAIEMANLKAEISKE
ncbi:MAG: 6,7-dimethyl-8-ribityllumazine synthase [Candidatus Omnitrophica bacterium]|nr:6,7-dimethyl-8-ribityllumazine synthase [Candidatus Omnitrophota bacterium]